jgi:hypothetical protein
MHDPQIGICATETEFARFAKNGLTGHYRC